MSSSRFEKLERSRDREPEDKKDSSSRGASLERFGSSGEGQAREADLQPAAMERFEADGAEGLRVERREDDVQPFTRCPVCERDWGRFDTRCGQCGEALDSTKAKDFNAALWSQRQAQRKVDDEGVAERALQMERANVEAAEEKRRYATLLAAEVRQNYELQAPEPVLLPVRWRYQVWTGIPVCVLMALGTHGPARWIFGGIAAVLIVSRLPSQVWSALFKTRDR